MLMLNKKKTDHAFNRTLGYCGDQGTNESGINFTNILFLLQNEQMYDNLRIKNNKELPGSNYKRHL